MLLMITLPNLIQRSRNQAQIWTNSSRALNHHENFKTCKTSIARELYYKPNLDVTWVHHLK